MQKYEVSGLLFTGMDNARSSNELCSVLGISRRELTQAIEKERRAGQPICASTDSKRPGYYLAADKGEMQRFCDSLRHRAGEIFKTRGACIKTIEQLPDLPTTTTK